MAFVPRTKETILTDMLNYVQLQTKLTDFEIGSIIRSILEAAAIEDDEQYFQMVQLLDAFSIQNATKSTLEERIAEFDVDRLDPAGSSGEITIQDGVLEKSTLAFDTSVAALALQLEDSSEFPTSGFPYNVRIGEGTLSVEDVAVSAHNTSTNTLTTAATANAHSIGDRVAFVSGATDQTLSAGISVQVPASGTSAPIVFTTTESGTLVNGNFESTTIAALAAVPGSTSSVGVGKVVEFTAAPPFDGALVTNKTAFSGGRDVEKDSELRDRGRQKVQSLSKATKLALKQAALGVVDSASGQRVTTASVKEDFVNDELIVYVDDGTGFSPDKTELARSTVAVAVVALDPTIQIADTTGFPDEGYFVVSPESASQIELLEYSSINRTTNVITLVGTAANAHDISDELALVDLIELSAESGTNFLSAQETALVRNSIRLWVDPGGVGAPALQTDGTDYIVNRGTGEIEILGAGLAASSVVFSNYSFYTGLISSVQKIMEGDADDEVNFPGEKAGGVMLVVETPAVRRITVRISITAKEGISEDDLVPLVEEAIDAYIAGLGIGDNVIAAKLVERTMSVNGVFNANLTVPTTDVVVLENELTIASDSNGNSLIYVT